MTEIKFKRLFLIGAFLVVVICGYQYWHRRVTRYQQLSGTETKIVVVDDLQVTVPFGFRIKRGTDELEIKEENTEASKPAILGVKIFRNAKDPRVIEDFDHWGQYPPPQKHSNVTINGIPFERAEWIYDHYSGIPVSPWAWDIIYQSARNGIPIIQFTLFGYDKDAIELLEQIVHQSKRIRAQSQSQIR